MPAQMPPLLQRLSRIAPFFLQRRLGIAAVLLASAVAAATEPMVAQLLKGLIDRGFKDRSLPLWVWPIAFVGLFTVRGIAGYIAQLALAWTVQHGLQELRQKRLRGYGVYSEA